MRIGRYALWTALATTGCGALATAGTPDDAGVSTDATDATTSPSGDAAVLRDGQPVSDADASLPPGSPDLSGRWALFGFEDPVAVEIRQSGTTLTGMGCSAGFASPGGPPRGEYCGSLFASVFDGTHAQFNYRFESYWYGADVTVSENGRPDDGHVSRYVSLVRPHGVVADRPRCAMARHSRNRCVLAGSGYRQGGKLRFES